MTGRDWLACSTGNRSLWWKQPGPGENRESEFTSVFLREHVLIWMVLTVNVSVPEFCWKCPWTSNSVCKCLCVVLVKPCWVFKSLAVLCNNHIFKKNGVFLSCGRSCFNLMQSNFTKRLSEAYLEHFRLVFKDLRVIEKLVVIKTQFIILHLTQFIKNGL